MIQFPIKYAILSTHTLSLKTPKC